VEVKATLFSSSTTRDLSEIAETSDLRTTRIRSSAVFSNWENRKLKTMDWVRLSQRRSRTGLSCNTAQATKRLRERTSTKGPVIFKGCEEGGRKLRIARKGSFNTLTGSYSLRRKGMTVSLRKTRCCACSSQVSPSLLVPQRQLTIYITKKRGANTAILRSLLSW